MHTFRILTLAAVANVATINASTAMRPGAYDDPPDSPKTPTSESSHDPSTSRPIVDHVDENTAASHNTKRRFGANAFIGSAVRSSQQALFKSVVEDINIVGSPVQTKVLDTKNFGFVAFYLSVGGPIHSQLSLPSISR